MGTFKDKGNHVLSLVKVESYVISRLCLVATGDRMICNAAIPENHTEENKHDIPFHHIIQTYC